MIRKTTKARVRRQIRRTKEATKRNLIRGHYAKYRDDKNWVKAHAALLREVSDAA